MSERLTRLFPLWAAALAACALWQPQWWAPAKVAIVPLLALVMFAMGLSLTWGHFRAILARPGIVLLGVGLQFLIMPAAAYLIGQGLGLATAHLAGLVLVGSSAGGTASNVICYLARGNVALSVLMTLTSTLAAVAATPLLTWVYLHQQVPVPATSMLLSIGQIVVLPLAAGVACNTWMGRHIAPLRRSGPLVASLAIAVIIAIIVALNRETLLQAGAPVMLAVVLHNLTGLALGYWIPALFGLDPVTRRTLAIEVGMQNSGLSVALAVEYFSPAAALPGALFSLWHNLSGSLLAGWWRRR
ncbi:bile acid:Na+ symporter, BASS family [Methylomarinovum tepidoasis]|uniref:Bile acid:Na+ symporter, BASS family n=1 Tax=Methylomarinovum tepidoasis TaxID=2840183 RepID=A0AAU9CXY8_9GAMM|nr:bile acid:sodium symporter family protein [Methylomarinovum sp. IN45]BCX88904.1 bile acid:Na+ symporter, BASS family [Methylomarinovum sp. IN45]